MRLALGWIVVVAMLAGCTGEVSRDQESDVVAAEAELHGFAARWFIHRWLTRICTTRDGDYNCGCARWYNPDDVDCSGGGMETGMDECAEGTDNCHEDATCTDLADGFACECGAGFEGDGVGACDDVDECEAGLDNCDDNAACGNTVGGFECTCNEGFEGDGVECEPEGVDECAAGTDDCDDNATCTDLDDGFSCACNEGFAGDGVTCEESAVDECADGTADCDENATCTDTADGYECDCNAGFEGDGVTCAPAAVNECADGTANCDANATCTDTAAGFTCACNAGFVGDGITCTPAAVNECADGTANCDANATCTDTAAGFTCACNAGFVGDGQSCANVDECASGTANCGANATCTDTAGSFTCACNAGFSGDGITCTPDLVNECDNGTANCDANATCTDTADSFTCACNGGYEGDGQSCTNVDECETGEATCDANAACTDTPGSFVCACNGGYEGDGQSCTNVDECETGEATCDANAICADTAGSFTCTCNPGYEGDGESCADIDECAAQADPCDGAAECINNPGGFECACPEGSGDGPGCSCDMTGTFATIVEMDVEWPAVMLFGFPVLDAGSDTVTSWAIRRHSQDGAEVTVEEVACGATSSDICSTLLGESYAQETPLSIFGTPSMPKALSSFEIGAMPMPGSAYPGAMEVTLVGLSLPNPAGAWPTSASAPGVTWVDHDDDGAPGFSVYTRTSGESASCGMPYAGVPIPAGATGQERAAIVYTGTRTIAQYTGALTSCDVVEGALGGPAGGFPAQAARVVGCQRTDGVECTEAEAASFDADADQTNNTVLSSRFKMIRVADDISCEQVRALNFDL